jgi:hypothetical protein
LNLFGDPTVPFRGVTAIAFQYPSGLPELVAPNEPITIQDVLERSGATRKYRNMDIMIHRVVEETGRVLKLRVDYEPRKKSVKPELNYAIHDKDRILVQSRTTTAISKVVDSLNPNQ